MGAVGRSLIGIVVSDRGRSPVPLAGEGARKQELSVIGARRGPVIAQHLAGGTLGRGVVAPREGRVSLLDRELRTARGMGPLPRNGRRDVADARRRRAHWDRSRGRSAPAAFQALKTKAQIAQLLAE